MNDDDIVDRVRPLALTDATLIAVVRKLNGNFAGLLFEQEMFVASDLRGLDFSGINFRQAILPQADFSGAILSDAYFEIRILSGPASRTQKLVKAHFSGAFWRIGAGSNERIRHSCMGTDFDFRQLTPQTLIGGL